MRVSSCSSFRIEADQPICWHGHSLGVGLLHQCTPELVAVVGVTIDQLVVDSREPVVNHHVNPLTEAPEAKVENSGIRIWLLRVPLLLLPVGDDLGDRGGERGAENGGETKTAGRL